MPFIHEWNQDPKRPAFRGMGMREALLSEDSLCGKLIYFKDLIGENTRLSVLETQIKQTLAEKGPKANIENCPAFRWFQMLPDRLQEDHWTSWIEERITEAIPKNLGYAIDLLGIELALAKERSLRLDPARLRSVIISSLQNSFNGKPEVLVASLDQERPNTVSRLIRLFSEISEPFHREEWPTLSQTLLQAGEKNAELIVPQLAMLLTSKNREQLPNRSTHYVGEFNDNLIKELFSPELDRLMRLLAFGYNLSASNGEIKLRIQCCRLRAREWLAENEKHDNQG